MLDLSDNPGELEFPVQLYVQHTAVCTDKMRGLDPMQEVRGRAKDVVEHLHSQHGLTTDIRKLGAGGRRRLNEIANKVRGGSAKPR